MCDRPEYLSRRYRALDELINELSLVVSSQDNPNTLSKDSDDASRNLLCKIWEILKEDPDCILSKEVHQRIGLDKNTARNFRPQRLTCYMAEQDDRNDNVKKYCSVHDVENEEPKPGDSPDSESVACCDYRSGTLRSTTQSLPLSKILCNLKEAVSFEKRCNERIGELIKTQDLLLEQIQQLECKEKEGIKLLKQAECMWSCMEATYKKNIKESLERQSELLEQMKQVETSHIKWRKNNKDLELQLNNLDMCIQDIKEKIHQKNSDVKCLKMCIDNFKKVIENNHNQIIAAQNSFGKKKKALNAKIASLSAQITKAKKAVEDGQNYKRDKEIQGSNCVKEVREDLHRMYRLTLERKLENEDLRAEKETLIKELKSLKQTLKIAKDESKRKEKAVTDEIAKVDAEIAGFKVQCIRCHKFTDTADVRKLCTDCPRCSQERECLNKDGQCHWDDSMDCVCMSTKEKFMNNIFDNMYSILEQKAKTREGKDMADAVLKCVQKSRNGKLNEPTRKLLQDFVLTTVKENLTLTIIGGAIKTRCEMDQDTYKQLMLCLDLVKEKGKEKEAEKDVSKKEPCSQWGNVTKCNCPNGPKDCICKRKDLYNPKDPESRPPEDKQDIGEKTTPTKESKPDEVECYKHQNAVGKEVTSLKPNDCNDCKCTFTKDMRAAQCILGSDSLTTALKISGFQSKMSHYPAVSVLENQIVCKCGSTPTKPCACRTDLREQKIEEVMGRYTDVIPIQKITENDVNLNADLKSGENNIRHASSNIHTKEAIKLNMSEISSHTSAYPSSFTVEELSYYTEIHEKEHFSICSETNEHCTCLKENSNVMIVKPQRLQKVVHKKTVDKTAVQNNHKLTNTDVNKPQSIAVEVEPETSNKSEYDIENKSIQNSILTMFSKCVDLRVKVIKNSTSEESKKQSRRSSHTKKKTSVHRSYIKTGNTIENEVEMNSIELNTDGNKLTNIKTQTKVPIKPQHECEQRHSLVNLVINDRIQTTTINCVYLSDSFEDSSEISYGKSLQASDVSSE